MRVAINGFGRIGRNFLRAVLADPKARETLQVVAINIGPARPEFAAHMFKYDTLLGKYPGTVELKSENELVVDGNAIRLLTEPDPELTGWKKLDVDWVIESSGRFTEHDDAARHLTSGARWVLISAPAKDEDITIIPGVNEDQFDPGRQHIVSLGSCTANAVIPVLKVLLDTFGVRYGCMTTVHAYTNTQVLIDVEDTDERRSRAAALNIVPTGTGATKVIGKVLPELAGLVSGVAVRVPVAKVSLIDLVVELAQDPSTPEKINDALRAAARGRMNGVLDVSMEPLVSTDFYGDNHSVIIDGPLTKVRGNLAQIFGWYDNEWGYSVRLKDFLLYVAQR